MHFMLSILFISSVVVEASKNHLIPTVKETYAIKGCNNTPNNLVFNELWQDYTLIYPQITGNSTFLINFNKQGQVKKRICRKTTDLTLKQLCRTDEKFGSGSVFNRTTKEMIDKPRARIFWETNFQGSFEDILFIKPEGICEDLEKLWSNARSVETFGSCVRVFSDVQCEGWSLAIYPGSNNSHEILNTLLTQVWSVGPCLNDEFLYASFEDATKRTIAKDPRFNQYNPDLVEFYSESKRAKAKILPGFSDVTHYLVGRKKRVEFLGFYFKSEKELEIGTEEEPEKDSEEESEESEEDPEKKTENYSVASKSEENDEFSKSLEKEDGDELTFIIPLSIGGQNETFNIFHASPDCVENWNVIISKIPQKMIESNIVINFVYERDNSTRPIFFYYHIAYKLNRSDHYFYGRILNGNRVKINLDAQPQIFHKIETFPKSLGLPLQQLGQIFKYWTNDATEYYSNSSIPNCNKPLENLSLEMDCQTICRSFEVIHESSYIANGSHVPDGYIQDVIGFNGASAAYSRENYTGKLTKRFSSGIFKRCNYLPDTARVESIEIFGKCIRLHENRNCKGRSLAVYPGSENSHAVLQFGLTKIRSVGPCYHQEFLNSTFSDASKGHISKDRTSSHYIPDFLFKPIRKSSLSK